MSHPTPPHPDGGEVTRLLRRWTAGDSGAVDDLVPLVYAELRQLAQSYLRRERDGHTLLPTGLVHEAYLRLLGTDMARATVENRGHFFALAAQAMRRILVEHARRHAAAKRPSPAAGVSLDHLETAGQHDLGPVHQILAVHEALDRLREDHSRQAKVVELRYFAGLSEAEVAETLDLSRATVARDWRVARMLLARTLRPPEAP